MLQLRRLSQAGFVLRAGSTTLLIDAFLSPRADRLVPPTVTPRDLAGANAILATHEHRDHLDPDLESLAAASPAAAVIVPAPIADAVRARVPPHRVVAAVVGEPITIGAATVLPVPARHGVTMADAYGFGPEPGRHRFLGYVIALGGVRVYHAGDTIRYDGMAETLRDLRVDLALLPINGRDAEREARGVVGNLDHTGAADLAADARIPAMVPMHHDTIRGNTGRVADLRAYATARHPALRIVELAPFAETTWPTG
jgi:L-ascorbate metabolism protein UlaG (beta-lactamase superfamily)